MSSIALTHKLSYDVVPSGRNAQLIYMLVRIDASNAHPIKAPIVISAVVDKSESMMLPMLTEEQLNKLRHRGIVRSTERDGVQVWEFRGFMLPPELRDAPRPFDFVKRALHSMVEHLQEDDKFALVAFASNAKVVLQMQSVKAGVNMTKAIEDIERLNLGDETLLSNALQLAHEQLMLTLSETALRRIIVITDGYARDESRCIEAGKQIADDGIRITTMGVGVYFNEELMVKLADMSGGEAFFIPDPSQIPNAIDVELHQSRLIALKQAVFELRLAKGVEIRRAYRVRPTIAPIERIYSRGSQSVELHIGDLQIGVSELLVELLVPPRSEGLYRIGQLLLRSGDAQAASADVLLRYQTGISLAQPDADVMGAASLVSAAELQTKALQDLKLGDVASATVKLKAARTRLLNVGASTKHIDDLLSEIKRDGKPSPHATKRVRYETRRLS